MSAKSFRDALASRGMMAEVSEEGRVAVIRAAEVALDRASRRELAALGREHGFSNVALELMPDAGLSGD